MTWNPTTNLIQTDLLTPERRDALKAWPHGHEFYCASEWSECYPNWISNYVYRGKPAPVVTSVWINVYPSMMYKPRESRADADLYAAPNRIAVLRIDTCNGVSTAHLEGLNDE